MNKRTAALIATPLVLVAGAVVGLSTLDGETAGNPNQVEADKRLAEAYFDCRKDATTPKGGNTLELADTSRTLLVDTLPLEGYGESDDNPGGLVCVLDRLNTPKSVLSRMERTTSLQGVQETEYDGIYYSWTYHPDHGAEVTITYAEGTL